MGSCPQCASQCYWKAGLRLTKHGDVQRYVCRECGHRFSEYDGQPVNRAFKHRFHCQIGAKPKAHGLVENLVTVEPLREGALREATADTKGKIVEFAWFMKKQGYAEITIYIYSNSIEVLSKRGADIFDAESVKETIAQQNWGQARKNIAINAYSLFLKVLGLSWEPPIYRKPTRKIPFIPTESEIDQLIAACGKKTATFLQLLKETAMRSGEANKIEWSNIDLQRRTITLNKPEKNGNPRIFNSSHKLIDMLNALPRKDIRVFGISHHWYKSTFYKSRKRIVRKLQNPRIAKIHLHTLRHWKATMLYHQTKDIIYVKEFLGHKRIEDTMLYIQVAEVLFKETTDQFNVRVAKKPKEIQGLIEVGFEYVCEKDGLMFFRKRK